MFVTLLCSGTFNQMYSLSGISFTGANKKNYVYILLQGDFVYYNRS